MEQTPLIPEVLQDRRAPAPNGGKGRPPGARNLKHRALERAARAEALPILQKLIELAKDGDTLAARIIFDRIWPRPKTAFIGLQLPETRTPADLRAAMHQLLGRVAAGEVPPDAGAATVSIMRDVLESHRLQTIGDSPAATSSEESTRELLLKRLTRAIEDRQRAAARADHPPPPAEPDAA